MGKSATSKYKRLAKDTGLFTISNFGSKILIFLLTPLYTNILATEEYGIADLFMTTIYFIYPILTIAIAEATLRYALDKEVDKKKVFIISNTIVLLSVLILFICKPVICAIDDSFEKYWIVFVVNFLLFNTQNNLANFVKGIQKTSLFAIQGLIHTLTIIICNILFLVVLRMGLEGYLLSIIIGYIIPIILMFFGGKLYQYVCPVSIDRTLLMDMIKYSVPMIPSLLAWTINTSINKYMIIWFYGLSVSGIYSVAYKIPTIITTILSIFTQAWQISVISNHGSTDESHFYTVVYNGLDTVSIFGCFILILICKPLAHLLYAKEFFEAWKYVPLLIISAMFSSHSGFLAAAFRAAKKTKSIFVSVMVGAIINIILNYILLRTIGVTGAALATAVSFMSIWLVRVILIQRIVKVDINLANALVSYGLLFLSAILMTLDLQYSEIVLVVSFTIVCILKRATIYSMYKLAKKIIKR